MRLLFGMILGAALTVGAAYIHDIASAGSVAGTTTQRPMVNWDVVAENWRILKDRARDGWSRLTKATPADRAARRFFPECLPRSHQPGQRC